jgi:hypothetical protein
MGNMAASNALASAAIDILTDIHERTASESCRQINRLTYDMRDFTEEKAEQIKKNILAQPLVSFYGYMRVPLELTDADVVQMLSYNDSRDTHFEQVMLILQLDFVWYDNIGRHVMVWGKTARIIEAAISAIQLWMKISPELLTKEEWMHR